MESVTPQPTCTTQNNVANQQAMNWGKPELNEIYQLLCDPDISGDWNAAMSKRIVAQSRIIDLFLIADADPGTPTGMKTIHILTQMACHFAEYKNKNIVAATLIWEKVRDICGAKGGPDNPGLQCFREALAFIVKGFLQECPNNTDAQRLQEELNCRNLENKNNGDLYLQKAKINEARAAKSFFKEGHTKQAIEEYTTALKYYNKIDNEFYNTNPEAKRQADCARLSLAVLLDDANSDAKYNLAMWFLSGKAISDEDQLKARELLQVPAKAGHGMAAYTLFFLSLPCIGIRNKEASTESAHRFYKIAVATFKKELEKGNDRHALELAHLYLKAATLSKLLKEPIPFPKKNQVTQLLSKLPKENLTGQAHELFVICVSDELNLRNTYAPIDLGIIRESARKSFPEKEAEAPAMEESTPVFEDNNPVSTYDRPVVMAKSETADNSDDLDLVRDAKINSLKDVKGLSAPHAAKFCFDHLQDIMQKSLKNTDYLNVLKELIDKIIDQNIKRVDVIFRVLQLVARESNAPAWKSVADKLLTALHTASEKNTYATRCLIKLYGKGGIAENLPKSKELLEQHRQKADALIKEEELSHKFKFHKNLEKVVAIAADLNEFGDKKGAKKIIATLLIKAYHLIACIKTGDRPEKFQVDDIREILNAIDNTFSLSDDLYILERSALQEYMRSAHGGHGFVSDFSLIPKNLKADKTHEKHELANYLLGLISILKKKSAQDGCDAMYYFKKSAALQFQPAMDLMGTEANLSKHFRNYQISVFYEKGILAAGNSKQKAWQFLESAASEGEPEALVRKANIYRYGDAFYSDIKRNDSEGTNCLKAATTKENITKHTTTADKKSIGEAQVLLEELRQEEHKRALTDIARQKEG